MIHIITPPFDITPLRGVTREFVDIFKADMQALHDLTNEFIN